MKILMVAAENDAIEGAKVGGMADVIRDVPLALAEQGHQVSVIIPDYGDYALRYPARQIACYSVPFAGKLEEVSLTELELPLLNSVKTSIKNQHGSVQQMVISHPIFTAQGIGRVYFDDESSRPFASDANKYALFNAAVLEALIQKHVARPDVLHLHDWHSAFITVLIEYSTRYKSLKSITSVFTVHNLALQGIRPLQGDESSLEAWFGSLSYDGQVICDPRYPHCINPMRAAINLADKVHFVSPTYAQEVLLSSEHKQGIYGGEGLEKDLMNACNESRLVGILNGCQYDSTESDNVINQEQMLTTAKQELFTWMARSEQLSSSHYIASQRIIAWAEQNKGINVPSVSNAGPLVTSVGRLTDQKLLLLRKDETLSGNSSLLSRILDKLAQANGRLIILSSGDRKIALELTQLMAKHDNFLFLNGYGQGLSDAIYQSGDLFFMPSSFEPCGISQMLALRAGQPCLVHAVGGLKDTVQHMENGFCFRGNSIAEQQEQLLTVFNLAIHTFQEENNTWQQLVTCAQQSRFSWQESVALYVRDLYS
ncbi:MAG: glycogen synthase [Colwellia sp.]|nr:glycogen synthase [Colwellia sp.]